jgi:hypothetical protein
MSKKIHIYLNLTKITCVAVDNCPYFFRLIGARKTPDNYPSAIPWVLSEAVGSGAQCLCRTYVYFSIRGVLYASAQENPVELLLIICQQYEKLIVHTPLLRFSIRRRNSDMISRYSSTPRYLSSMPLSMFGLSLTSIT